MRRFLYWYVSTFILACIALVGLLYFYDLSFQEIMEVYPDVFRQAVRTWMFWLILGIPYLVGLLFSFVYNAYRKYGFKIAFKRLSYSTVLPIILIYSFLRFMDYHTQREDFDYTWNNLIENNTSKASQRYSIDAKQRGVHVFGRIDSSTIKPLIRNNFEWITLVPFLGMDDYDSPSIRSHRLDTVHLNRRDSAWITKIKFAHERGFRIMFKPHIWISSPSAGKWRSDIYPKNDEHWQEWSKSYRKIILHYAKIAALTDVELFCVGTELSRLAKEKPEFWIQLIKDVRNIYPGEITYAANWNEEYEEISFWNHLDYIGVQAYFPLTSKMKPSVSDIKKGWGKHIKTLEKVHQQYNRPILFTELGYKSTIDSAHKPWEWVNMRSSIFKKASHETQVACYQAFFETIWTQDWFAGLHIWQWHSNRSDDGNKKHLGFSPQFKPAENTIAIGFSQ